MAAVVDVDKLNGEFNLTSVAVYNVVNVGRYIVNTFENTYNFCSELKLLNRNRACPHCRRA